MGLLVHIGPEAPQCLLDAVTAAGGEIAKRDDADAIVWLRPQPESLGPLPPRVRWVQLPGAGVNQWLDTIRSSREVTFTSATGVYARPVAEHALTLLLAGVKRLGEAARTTSWERLWGGSLEGAVVAVIGAGGIGRVLIEMLAPHRVEVIAVTRSGREVPGAARSLGADRTAEVWSAADHVVLAAPSTAATRHLVGADQLAAMRRHAWLVNVARGTLVDTEALVAALDSGQIAGAALDVTDPEPLPDGHPLWNHPRALITAHVATQSATASPYFAARVRENVARFIAGEPLVSAVDPEADY